MKRWSPEQIVTLMAVAGTMTVKQMTAVIGKSETALRVKACRHRKTLAVPRETARGKRILKRRGV